MRQRLLAMAVAVATTLASFACSSGEATRVLFIGNSYTFTNDLPGMVRDLAEASGNRVIVETRAEGGWWLRDHAASPTTLEKIADGDFDYVVLQEQSQVSSVPSMADSETRPAARQLAIAAVEGGAHVVLFMTWGHRNGSPDAGHDSYDSMQIAVSNTYTELGRALAAKVARVGVAWWMARAERPEIVLYQPDGSHPSVEGTYLAAAVLTSTILSVDARELDDDLGLVPATAQALRGFAARAVLGEIPWS